MPLALNKKWVVSFGPKAIKVMEKIDKYFNDSSCSSVASLSVDLGNALESVEILNSMRSGNLIQHVFSTSEADFKNHIASLKRQSVNCLLLFMLSEQANSFANQLKQFKFTPNIIGGDVFDDYQFLMRTRASALPVAFADGAVTDKFRKEMLSQKKNFVYSIAVGYVISKIAFDISNISKLSENFITNLKLSENTNLPIEELKLLNDEEYGWHFENDIKIYFNKF
jgi:hypothetical protein